jgi:D-lactate dehydrogenase (cytochrome)
MWQLSKTESTRLGFEWYAFGHIGNSHIHVNILPRDMNELNAGKQLFEQFASRAVELGGTVSAEHGIGKLKQVFFQLMYTASEVDQMRAVKRALDPNGILNLGVLFPIDW